MNCKYYNYLVKNIQLPSEKLYQTILIEKVELVTKRMRWKVHPYGNSELNASYLLNHIFQSMKYPPQHRDLMQFENHLLELISVKFRNVKNKFLDQLHKVVSSIKKSKNVFIFVDKTRNI